LHHIFTLLLKIKEIVKYYCSNKQGLENLVWFFYSEGRCKEIFSGAELFPSSFPCTIREFIVLTFQIHLT